MKLWQAGALVGAGLVAGAIAMRVAAPTAGDAAQKPAAAAEADAGEGLKIDEATAKAAALQTAALEPGQVGETRDGYARALDPQPLGTIAAEIAAARAAHDGSRRELDRLTGLVAADAGATQRDLDAARATEGQDRARLTLACRQAALQIGPGLGALGCDAVERLADQAVHGRAAVLRLDFPDGPPPAGAAVTVDLDGTGVPVRVLGAASAGDTQLQTAGVLALLTGPAAAHAGVGRVVAAHRALGGATAGLIVPRSAVLRVDGALQVWRAAGDRFERVAIDGPGVRSVAAGWFVPEGGTLHRGDRLVVSGAGTLLGIERQGAADAGGGD